MEIVPLEIFEQDVFRGRRPKLHGDVFAVFVDEGDPLEKMRIFVRMGGIFVPDPDDDPFRSFPERRDVLPFFFGKVAVIEGLVDVFRHRVEKLLRGSARGAGEGIGDRFERGSRGDFQLFFPECGAVEVGTLRTGVFFHEIFRTLRIADFRQNTRFARGRRFDFPAFRV